MKRLCIVDGENNPARECYPIGSDVEIEKTALLNLVIPVADICFPLLSPLDTGLNRLPAQMRQKLSAEA